MKIQKLAFVLLGSALLSASALAEEAVSASPFVNIKINSGNPTYPFPQFQEYKGGGKSLAKYNAEGVTHADMEKTMREAYEIMSHRCRYEKTEQSGVKYITFNNVNDYEELEPVPVFCTEGDGYMLLASAIFADQPTFNGLWMWIHDNRMSDVKRYSDGKWLRKGDRHGGLADFYLTAKDSVGYNGSATDGDNDIAMALLIAYKQWGEFMRQDGEIVKDFEGNPISYKQIAEDYVKALVDTIRWEDHSSYLTGDIGIDGYPKGGNVYGELTDWSGKQTICKELDGLRPLGVGEWLSHPDYNAPSYYTEFADWLENGDGNGTEWEISQFKRAAASSNWLNKQAYDQGLIPSIGNVGIKDDTVVTFEAYNEGEDFRYPWRHMLDYLWHGDAADGWDPIAHMVIKGQKNTSEYDMAIRYAALLKEPSNNGEISCSQLSKIPSLTDRKWSGISQVPSCWDLHGIPESSFFTNFALGAGSPAAVISGDVDLVADLYRQCELMWSCDYEERSSDADGRYINATPNYFHGWFRTLGMLVASGNMMAPSEMLGNANVKVYMSVDKTFAKKGDVVTYGVQCRNYGSKAAENLVVTTQLDSAYTFVEASKNGTYDASTHSVVWKIASLPGFVSDALNATIDSLSLKVRVAESASGRVALSSSVSGSNFEPWVSNEFPNNATYTMERNIVDIVSSPINIGKFGLEKAVEGDTVLISLVISNDTVPSLTGGRDNVNISYAPMAMDGNRYVFLRFWNDAYEAYVNMGNYRFSYFLYDSVPVSECRLDNVQDLEKIGCDPTLIAEFQNLPSGETEDGKWNQRVMLRLNDNLMAPSSYLEQFDLHPGNIHKGIYSHLPIRIAFQAEPMIWPLPDVEDWSLDSLPFSVNYEDSNWKMVSPGWAKYDDQNYPIEKLARNICADKEEDVTSRILVEEWDGYTWRKILGSSPVEGRPFESVKVYDSIPGYLEFVDVVDSANCDINLAGGLLSASMPILNVGVKDTIRYRCIVKKGAPDLITLPSAVCVAEGDSCSSDGLQLEISKLTRIEELTNLFDENERVDVYNALGALLRKHVLWKNALNGLPTGVYMVNNKKVVYKE